MTENANDFRVTSTILTIQSKTITTIKIKEKKKIKRRLTTSNCLFINILYRYEYRGVPNNPNDINLEVKQKKYPTGQRGGVISIPIMPTTNRMWN
jgi:hypothetical protein